MEQPSLNIIAEGIPGGFRTVAIESGESVVSKPQCMKGLMDNDSPKLIYVRETSLETYDNCMRLNMIPAHPSPRRAPDRGFLSFAYEVPDFVEFLHDCISIEMERIWREESPRLCHF